MVGSSQFLMIVLFVFSAVFTIPSYGSVGTNFDLCVCNVSSSAPSNFGYLPTLIPTSNCSTGVCPDLCYQNYGVNPSNSTETSWIISSCFINNDKEDENLENEVSEIQKEIESVWNVFDYLYGKNTYIGKDIGALEVHYNISS